MRKLFLALLLAPIALCNAQDTLPSAETILNKFLDATGGRAALEKRHNQVEHGTVEMAAMGIKGDLIIYEAEPNKNRMVIDLTGIGKIESGTDGTVAWENNPLQGPRVKQGVELVDALRDATFNAALSVQKLYSKIETTGTETTEGHDCYKVVLTPKEGNPTAEYYDKTSGLLVKTSATRTTAMGDVAVEMVFDDYRKDGDLVLPHKLTQRLAQTEIQILVEKTEVNVDLPKGVFDPPAEIQELAKKAPQAASNAPAPAAASAPGSGKLTVYMAGKPTESESYTVEKSDGKIVLNGSGHAAIGPMKVDIDEFNIVTDEKFQPIEADAKGKMGQIQMNVKTSFAGGKASNVVDNGQGAQTKEDAVHPDAIVVYNPFPFYPWTVLAMRTQLKNQDPQQFPIYVLNQGEVPATVVFKGREPVEFADKTVELNHIVASGKTPQGQPLSLDFWVDDNRKLIKIAVPSQGVEGYQEGYDRKAPPATPTAEAPKANSK
jgi:hypothetical protein